MKEAILVVSFGTTHLDTLRKTIFAAEEDIRAAFPDIECRRAFTSSIVRKRLKEKFDITVDSVEEALDRLFDEGFDHVVVQPTLLLPGEEFEILRSQAMGADLGMHISVGLPLLWDDNDLTFLAEALKAAYPLDEDTVLLAMGHGTSHEADLLYHRLLSRMNELGMELCTVEGSLDFDHAVKAMCARPQRKAHLVPLLLVAGDHAKNDMAGDEPDSLKSRLTDAGFSVTASLSGLGEIKAIRERYVYRIRCACGR